MDMTSEGARRPALEWFAGARVLAGAVMFLVPKTSGRIWIGPEGEQTAVSLITRSFAVRDVTIGWGTIRAIKHDRPLADWIRAGLLADLGDLVGAILLPRSKRRLILAGLSIGAVMTDLLALVGTEDGAREPLQSETGMMVDATVTHG